MREFFVQARDALAPDGEGSVTKNNTKGFGMEGVRAFFTRNRLKIRGIWIKIYHRPQSFNGGIAGIQHEKGIDIEGGRTDRTGSAGFSSEEYRR